MTIPAKQDTSSSQANIDIAVMVPVTEKLVIERLRATTDKISNPQHKVEITQVIKQEGIHARYHRAINTLLIEYGFTEIPVIERIQTALFKRLESVMPTSFVESIPAAMEHFTANISKAVLTDQAFWFGDKQTTDAARFLKWHAFEGLEHRRCVLISIKI